MRAFELLSNPVGNNFCIEVGTFDFFDFDPDFFAGQFEQFVFEDIDFGPFFPMTTWTCVQIVTSIFSLMRRILICDVPTQAGFFIK